MECRDVLKVREEIVLGLARELGETREAALAAHPLARLHRTGVTVTLSTDDRTVSDISLRSTRIRTPERTELSIPNGSLATMNVENLSRRDKMLFNTKIGLRYETESSPREIRSFRRRQRSLKTRACG